MRYKLEDEIDGYDITGVSLQLTSEDLKAFGRIRESLKELGNGVLFMHYIANRDCATFYDSLDNTLDFVTVFGIEVYLDGIIIEAYIDGERDNLRTEKIYYEDIESK